MMENDIHSTCPTCGEGKIRKNDKKENGDLEVKCSSCQEITLVAAADI